jgi:hypothetical protein
MGDLVPVTTIDELIRERRPPTPMWLSTFAMEIYGRRCIGCDEADEDLLDVAHLNDWRTIKAELVSLNQRRDAALSEGLATAFWIFHRPDNVVVLCVKCHRLYDRGRIERAEIIAARDKVLATPESAMAVLRYYCRGFTGTVGAIQHANVIARWRPLLQWLAVSYHKGLLPETPPRFRFGPYEMVDLTRGERSFIDKEDVDQQRLLLPLWTPKGFVTEQ